MSFFYACMSGARARICTAMLNHRIYINIYIHYNIYFIKIVFKAQIVVSLFLIFFIATNSTKEVYTNLN